MQTSIKNKMNNSIETHHVMSINLLANAAYLLFLGQGRTEYQCMQRWQKHLDPEIIKGFWSKDEDEKVGKIKNITFYTAVKR